MRDVVIVDAVRTPIGKYKGALKSVRPDDLGAIVIKALTERNPGLPPEQIEDVIFGNANQAGEDNRDVARMSALLAGLPVNVAGTTINRLCGSGLDAVMYAARSIAVGEGDIYIAGGTESMTRAPYVMAKPESDFPRGAMELQDTTIGWRFTNKKLEEMYGADSMPQTAENVAQRCSIRISLHFKVSCGQKQQWNPIVLRKKLYQFVFMIGKETRLSSIKTSIHVQIQRLKNLLNCVRFLRAGL
jgi:3-oxo-5,6-didehydrosuberyl-CoA/3-oxoadipyl-CoA thiolase